MTKRGRNLLRFGLLLAVSLLALEGTLRYLLFGRQPWVVRAAAPLRKELCYTSASSEDDCWKLRALFGGENALREHRYRDELLGWTNEEIEPGSYRHAAEPPPDGRRLVLLYGDSFARCPTSRAEAWEGLLAGSELGSSHVLLNYGVGGYGLDQIHLLLAATLDRYVERDPLVIVGILVDDDLDRTLLSLRNSPKPRFELAGDELVLHSPRTRSAAEFIAENPLGIRSYSWRFLLYGSGLVPERFRGLITGEERARDESRALCRRILAEARRLLLERGLDHFVVLFHANGAMYEIGPYSWQEPFLYETLRELGFPFVSSKRALLEDMSATGRPWSAYFTESRHYDAEGHRAVFPALVRGIQGRFEPSEGYLPGAPAHPRAAAQRE